MVDRTPPVLNLSGDLADDQTTTNPDGSQDTSYITTDQSLTASATDGSPDSPRSGVATVEMLVDNAQKHPEDLYYASCSTSGCPYAASPSFTLHVADIGAGDHAITLIARDQLAIPTDTTPGPHVTVQTFHVYVGTDGSPPDEASSSPPPGGPADVATQPDYLPIPSAAQVSQAAAITAADAANPLGSLHGVIGLTPYTVVETGPLVVGPSDMLTGVTERIQTSNPVANVNTSVPDWAPTSPGSASLAHFQESLVASSLHELLISVDLTSNTVIGITPGPDATVSTWAPFAGPDPVPAVTDNGYN